MFNEKRWTTFHASTRNDRLIDGLFIALDEEANIIEVQEDLAALLGYVPEEMQNRPLAEFLIKPKRFLDMLTATDDSGDGGLQLLGSNGSTLESEYTVFRIEGRRDVHYLAALHQLKGDAKLNLLQRFADTFIKDVNLGVMLINTDFELVEISDTACRVLGVRRENVLGRSMDQVFADVPEQHRLVQRTLLDGMIVKNHAVSWTNDRERYELIMDTSLLRDGQGQMVGAYVMFKDVSNLRSLEQQVQRSDRLAMIGQIAAGTAHEIRNPLTSIKGFLQVLKKTLNDNGMTKEYGYTEIMLTEIDRINDLVSEFLLLSKQKHTKLVQIEISNVIREILPIINSEAILHGVNVEYEPLREMPPIMGDREMLKQVFINLCKNGIEAMANEGGTLTIMEKTDSDEQRIHVFVQDTGPGIPAFLIDKIFDPFFTTKEQGTGLGLSVCQRIIHDIGGTLRVSSKGYGTTFVVSIPFSKA